MNDEKRELTTENYRELGIVQLCAKGLCEYQGKLLLEFDSGQSEMDRIYTIPGGTVNWGERSRDTLRRIFKERLGMDISVGRFLIVTENKFGTSSGRVHEVNIIFEVKTQSAGIDIQIPGLGARWIELNAIDRYNVHPEELREALFTQSLHRRKHMICGDLKHIR